MTLEKRYTDDPEFLEFYKEKLLEPGWAGDLDHVELQYIKSRLRELATLRRRWGFRPSAKRFSDSRVRDVAMNGVRRRQR